MSESATEYPTLIEVIPLQHKPGAVRPLADYFRGVRRAWEMMAYTPEARTERQLDGRPYAAAPDLTREVRHLISLQVATVNIMASGYTITPYETRQLLLREAALADRLALLLPGNEADATAVQAAWSLQIHDQAHRQGVAGEWQADAIHWDPHLSDDPASGSRLYVRQEYPLWLRAHREATRA